MSLELYKIQIFFFRFNCFACNCKTNCVFPYKFFTEENVVHYYVNKLHGKATRWLSCVQVKAGIPYSTLVAILFLSLVMMAWICCSACDDDEDEEDEIVEKVFFYLYSSRIAFFDSVRSSKQKF